MDSDRTCPVRSGWFSFSTTPLFLSLWLPRAVASANKSKQFLTPESMIFKYAVKVKSHLV